MPIFWFLIASPASIPLEDNPYTKHTGLQLQGLFNHQLQVLLYLKANLHNMSSFNTKTITDG